MSNSFEKLRKNIKEALNLNDYFYLQGYKDNEYLDVICTLIAFDLEGGDISEEIIDHIPILVRQIKNELNYLKKLLEKEDES